VDSQEVPTKAGLLALGVHPQQFFPRYVVNLAVESNRTRGADGGSSVGGTVRARELLTASGPVPLMLETCLDWARKVLTRDVVAADAGAVRDRWQYPLEAFRELVGNALVHRDLSSWSEGQAVEVRLWPDRLVVTSPGGLYGITRDRLGREGRTSARNARLIEVCRYARASDGSRVVETLAQGIPRVLHTLHADGLPEPIFHDTGVSFAVVLRSGGPRDAAGEPILTNETQTRVWAALERGPQTAAALSETTGLNQPTIRKALRAMAQRGLIEQHGGRGRTTTYQRL
jgi:ATP-dependent DNA helicase RecG